jgi:RNase P/RNase MRP subunit POP5
MPRKPSRYLLFKINADEAIHGEAVCLSITESIRHLFGETGLAEINPRFLKFDEKKLTGIVKCTRNSTEKLRAAIAFTSTCAGKPVCMYIPVVSGTLKGLKTRQR